LELRSAVKSHNGGVDAQKGTVEGLYASGRSFASIMRSRNRIGIGIRIKVKGRIRIRIKLMRDRITSTPVHMVPYIRRTVTYVSEKKLHIRNWFQHVTVQSALRTFLAELSGVSLRADALPVVAGAVVAAVRHFALIMPNEHNYISGMLCCCCRAIKIGLFIAR
jgi:hypothetical protein